jgi:geranyl-CoA carboxylase alpha subunit
MIQHHGEMWEIYPVAGDVYRYGIQEDEGGFTFNLEGEVPPDLESAVAFSIESRETGEGLCRTELGLSCPFAWAWVGQELHLWLDGTLFVFQRPETRRRDRAAAGAASGDILAPMPGAVLEVLVAEGDRVEQNQTVVIMESMKMELVITASRGGTVRRVAVVPGQQVERGMRLLELAPESGDGE